MSDTNDKKDAAEFAENFVKQLGLPAKTKKVKKRKNGTFDITFETSTGGKK